MITSQKAALAAAAVMFLGACDTAWSSGFEWGLGFGLGLTTAALIVLVVIGTVVSAGKR